MGANWRHIVQLMAPCYLFRPTTAKSNTQAGEPKGRGKALLLPYSSGSRLETRQMEVICAIMCACACILCLLTAKSTTHWGKPCCCLIVQGSGCSSLCLAKAQSKAHWRQRAGMISTFADVEITSREKCISLNWMSWQGDDIFLATDCASFQLGGYQNRLSFLLISFSVNRCTTLSADNWNWLVSNR